MQIELEKEIDDTQIKDQETLQNKRKELISTLRHGMNGLLLYRL